MINKDGDGSENRTWYHGSNFNCQICNKVFNNDQWYFHHFSKICKIYGIKKEKYNEQYGREM